MSPEDHGAIREVELAADPSLSRGRGPGARQGDAPRRVAWAARGGAARVRRRRGRVGRGPDRRGARAKRGVAADGGCLPCCSAATGSRCPAWRAGPRPRGRGRGRRGARAVGRAQGAGPGLLHKTEMGAVRAGLCTAQSRCAARPRRWTRPSPPPAGGASPSSSRRWPSRGAELLVGVVEDPIFGPVLACGAGGTEAELLKDVSVRICPVTRGDAGRDAPLPEDVPAADRLPRRAVGRPGQRSRTCSCG